MNPSRVRRHFHGKTKQLQKLCVTITDCHHSTPKWFNSGKWVVRSENIKSGRISLFPTSYTDEITFRERISRAIPEPGDLIITREAPMGEVGMIPNGVDCCLGQRLVLIKPNPKKIDARYLLYAMQSEYVQRQIGASDATGSTVSNLRIPLLKEVLVPLLDGQEEIGQVLATIDAKIDLNERINAELEALVQTIYDYWFVQFEFPDENGQPYKSSGGTMVWNELLKRDIPKDWSVKCLAEIVPISTSTVDPGNAPRKVFKHLSIPGLDATGTFVLEAGAAIGSDKFTVEVNDLLVSKLNPWFNRVFADTDHEALICSTEFVVWRCASATAQAYLNSVATHPTFVSHCTQSATGTSNSHKRVNPQVMMGFRVPHSSEIAARFGEVATSIVAKRIVNSRENAELAALRDWLLPLLMNGQVRVA